VVKRSPAVVVPYFTKLPSVTALKTFVQTVESRNSNLLSTQTAPRGHPEYQRAPIFII
jgi:hypothetical protein